jgi:hypothetical protein
MGIEREFVFVQLFISVLLTHGTGRLAVAFTLSLAGMGE